jgi:hypothetical protein
MLALLGFDRSGIRLPILSRAKPRRGAALVQAKIRRWRQTVAESQGGVAPGSQLASVRLRSNHFFSLSLSFAEHDMSMV